MDRRSIIRDKVAELTSDSARRRQEGWRFETVRRIQDGWRRFSTFSLMERFFIAGCGVLAMLLVPVAVIAISGQGGGDGSSAAARATNTPFAGVVGQPTENLAPTATRTPYVSPNRRNCDAIRGTAYRTDAERQWFERNCPTPEPTETQEKPTATPQGSGGNQPPPPPPPPPPPSPSPDEGLTAGAAISAAADWMEANAGAAYDVVGGSCNAIWIGNHFVVSCTLTLQGCTTSVCQETQSACVFADPVRVVPTSQC